MEHDFEHIGPKTMLLNARRFPPEGEYELLLLAIEDITDRKRLAAAVATSEVRYRRLFEAARDGILLVDPDTRRITDANPFMVELLGYPRDELVGKELWEIGLLADEQASREAFAELQRAGTIRYEDLPLQSEAGARREVEFVSNIYQENGHRVIQCNIRDITDRKRLEAERERLHRVAEEARARAEANEAKLAEADRRKDEFIAILAHELRNPLSNIRMAAHILRRPDWGGEPRAGPGGHRPPGRGPEPVNRGPARRLSHLEGQGPSQEGATGPRGRHRPRGRLGRGVGPGTRARAHPSRSPADP